MTIWGFPKGFEDGLCMQRVFKSLRKLNFAEGIRKISVLSSLELWTLLNIQDQSPKTKTWSLQLYNSQADLVRQDSPFKETMITNYKFTWYLLAILLCGNLPAVV
jgi:hypothetical protein